MSEQVTTTLAAVVLPIVMSFGVAFWAIYWGHRRKQLQFEERRLMIEKGMTPPPLTENRHHHRIATPADCLRRGTVMVFLGIGFAIGYFILLRLPIPNHAPDPWLLGITSAIVGLLGVGYLVYYFVVKNHPPQLPPERMDMKL